MCKVLEAMKRARAAAIEADRLMNARDQAIADSQGSLGPAESTAPKRTTVRLVLDGTGLWVSLQRGGDVFPLSLQEALELATWIEEQDLAALRKAQRGEEVAPEVGRHG